MQIKQFVKAGELPPELFDRHYFVAPEDEMQAKALNIMQKALSKTKTLGIVEIAFSGLERLVAISAPINTKQKGLMLYVLRYTEDLRDSKSTFAAIQDTKVEADELLLATQLINGSTSHATHLLTGMTTKQRSKTGRFKTERQAPSEGRAASTKGQRSQASWMGFAVV